MKWKHRDFKGLKDSQLTIFNRWGVQIVLNKYVHLKDLPIHDHRRNFLSIILKGGYIEDTYFPDANWLLTDSYIGAPSIVHRHRDVLHGVSTIDGCTCWTIQIYYGKKKKQTVIPRSEIIRDYVIQKT